MGKNVYVTPRNRDKWNAPAGGEGNNRASGDKQQAQAERARRLAEKYKQQKSRKQED